MATRTMAVCVMEPPSFCGSGLRATTSAGRSLNDAYANAEIGFHGEAVSTTRILCKAGEESFSLAARDGKVCLVRTDRDDDTQHWIKDMKYSIRVKDEEGYPAMALVNKASGEALKHSLGQSHPVLLTRYNPDTLDESVLWTESRDVGEGYRCIRMVNNIYLNFDALHGDKDHGGVREGTTLILWEWTEGDNQRWKIVAW
uniref:PH domain-containing protein n=1 Tax=Aegilops tauschii subsp. strangulata TaxID=200361 RepID=A0A453DZR6_AEGTS